jgi:DNA primase
MHEIELELNHLDESLDFALEFEGARTQLTEMVQQGLEVKLLNQIKEKPLSALSLEEREMLKKLTTKAIS